jgi:hypothetical protein
LKRSRAVVKAAEELEAIVEKFEKKEWTLGCYTNVCREWKQKCVKWKRNFAKYGTTQFMENIAGLSSNQY